MAIAGKLLGIKIDDLWIDCQTSANLTITTNTSEAEACKPADGTAETLTWVENQATSKTWSMSVSGQAFNVVVTSTINNLGIVDKLITGDAVVEVAFQTNSSAEGAQIIYEGTGILTNFSLDAEVEGNATYTVDITGSGALTSTVTP